MNLTVIILAAGKGTRMKCKKKHYSKVAFTILGKPIVSYVVNAVKAIKPTTIVTVVGFGGDITSKIVKNDSEIVWQKEQKGTGHAVLQAKKYIKSGKDSYTIVLCGDAPQIRGETLKKLVKFHINNKNDQTLVSAIVDNPFGYGRIVRDSHKKLVKVVEETDTNDKEKKIREVNSGVVMFSNNALLKGLTQLTNNNAKKEYYLTQLISIFLKNKYKVDAMIMKDPHEMDGINDRNQLALARIALKARIIE
ncbi:MAG: NTP transferase domain-containing protein [Bacilli bacterium]|nr:NTP transferase domain-containing protein [Bacilli bacterium]